MIPRNFALFRVIPRNYLVATKFRLKALFPGPRAAAPAAAAAAAAAAVAGTDRGRPARGPRSREQSGGFFFLQA